MAWSFSTDRPIFQQIADIIVLKIISGEYPPGYRLNAVRDLALEAGVNPNTMQRAAYDCGGRRNNLCQAWGRPLCYRGYRENSGVQNRICFKADS